ncbi:MAG: TldD/PmbA family protein [Alphaproteobacteria bacterium]|nr:TldD/PmbA family protein [Alphaproteobacteria bacterium]
MNLKRCLENLPIKADWVAIREIREEITSRSARNGRSDQNDVSIDHGYMVEVLIDGQFAYSSTNTHSEEAIQNAAKKAEELAKKTSINKLYPFTPSVRPKADGNYVFSSKTTPDTMPIADFVDILIQTTNTLKVSDKIVNAVAHAMVIDRDSYMVSSNGSDVYQQTLMTQLTLSATAGEGNETQTRTNGAPFTQQGLELLDKEILLETANKVGKEALELLTAEECPNGTFDLVLAPDQLYLQVHESIGHPLELDRILGDERNYAGWSFVKPSDFGTLQYGSSLLNVTFDPFVEREAASYAFDDVGNKATREYLIKDGVLMRGLGSLESQERLKLPGVANARISSWNRPPIDRMANINIEPGDSSFEEMISRIENGIYMQTNRSWSIDDYRNKFQFGCEYARRIQNGRLGAVLKNPNYRGISIPFWKSLRAVGNKESYKISGSPYCGKGEPNQVIRVGHAVPTCWFEKIDVFGGAG